MANHLHLLLQPPQGSDLPRIMQWIGWYSASGKSCSNLPSKVSSVPFSYRASTTNSASYVEQPVAMASPRTWCPSTGCFGAHDLEQHLAKRGLPQVRQAPIGILPQQRSHVCVGGGGQHQGVVKPGLRAGGTFAVRWESRLT
jgi:hypothetical protein